MQAMGPKADDRVARFDISRVEDFGAVDNADGKPRHVEIAGRIDGGHLRSLATEQRAPRFHAGVGNAFHHLRGHSRFETADGEVIEEKERFAPLNDQIVNVHRNEIDPDGVVLLEIGGNFDLGADAIGAGDEHRIFVVAGKKFFAKIQPEEAGEGAVLAEHTRGVRALAEVLDLVNHFVASSNVDAGFFVGQGCGFVGHAGEYNGGSEKWHGGGPVKVGVDGRTGFPYHAWL